MCAAKRLLAFQSLVAHAMRYGIGMFAHGGAELVKTFGWNTIRRAGGPDGGDRGAVLIKDGSGYAMRAADLFSAVEGESCKFHLIKFLVVGLAVGDGVFVVAFELGFFDQGCSFVGGEVGENERKLDKVVRSGDRRLVRTRACDESRACP